MSNYTQTTNFATKDALASGNPLKVVKGTEINTEFANIATAVATKSDISSPTFTGTITIPILSYAGTTLSAAVTGTGKMVLDTSPTLVTPALGTPASGVLTNCTGVQYNGFKNRIINGDFKIAQRGTSFTSGSNNDDTYNLDRWYVLSDGNDIVDITQTTTVPTGAQNSIGLDVETINKKFGIAQIIEASNCYDAIGGDVTLSFQAKVSSTTKLDNVKCAIIAWSGTADTVTSDIISAWGVEGTNPTLIANATYENSPANLNLTTSFASYSVTANVDTASTKNLILFIWSDVTDTTLGDFLHITNVQLEKGSVATSFDYRPYTTELQLCQRYYYQISAEGSSVVYMAQGQAESTTAAVGISFFPVSMRVAPSALEQTGTASDYRIRIDATNVAFSSVPTFGVATTYSASTNCTVASGLAAGKALAIRPNTSAVAYLGWSAEL